MTSIKLALLGAGLAAVSTAVSATSTTPATERVLIGSNRVEANGCRESSITFTTNVKDPGRLDRTYQGALSGIEIERVTGHGQISNVTWVNSNTITYQLSAKGGGFWIEPSKYLPGGGACLAGRSDWIEIRVFAHYGKSPR